LATEYLDEKKLAALSLDERTVGHRDERIEGVSRRASDDLPFNL
jgi:hypothetical protein